MTKGIATTSRGDQTAQPLTASFVADATVELSRFFRLWRNLGVPLAMFSRGIDRVWHDMLRDEATYKAFCCDTVGFPVRHGAAGGILYHGVYAPASANPAFDWIPAYERQHGSLPDIWFADEDGLVDQNHLALYREVGVIVSSWECTPQN